MAILAHRFRSAAPEGTPSRYARMIPGQASMIGDAKAACSPGATQAFDQPGLTRIRSARTFWTRLTELLPHPLAEDRFALYRSVLADLLALSIASVIPALISSGWALPWPLIPAYAVLVTLFGFSEGLYKLGIRPVTRWKVLVRSVCLGMLLVIVAARDDTSFPAVVLTLVTSLCLLLLWRYLLDRLARQNCTAQRNILIVGDTFAGRAIARQLQSDPTYRAVVRGFVDDRSTLSAQVIGRIEDLDWLARGEFIDEVIIALPNQTEAAREAAAAAFRNHLDIRAVPDLPVSPWPDAFVDRIGDIPIVTLHRESQPSLTLFAKRLLDVVGALFGLMLTMPMMAAVALAIRLDSRGPVLYAAPRTGAKGRRFPCYKFRSMCTDADLRKESLRARNQRQGPIFKIDDDPRITRVGRFIRRYSLDELPQLWNVLRGEMSLVGPRPHPVDEVNHYELHHYRRLDVKPGLTGLWQVTARKNPSFDLNVHLDLTYIENWTLLLDMRILARTLRVLFAPEGA